MMIMLPLYWHVDYLLWRDGAMMAAMNAMEGRLRSIKDIITDLEQFLAQGVEDNVKFLADHLASMKVEVLDYGRSIIETTRLVRFIIIGIHLVVPLALGLVAVWLVAEGVGAALSNLIG